MKMNNWAVFRSLLFLAGLSLAFYIVFKYTTQLHTINGFYAFLFPLSSFVALAGMYLAINPKSGCSCGGGLRIGVGAIAGGWLITGLSCTPSLAQHIISSPVSGIGATFQMLAQHVFLTLSIIAFAAFPGRMLVFFGIESAAAEKTKEPSKEEVVAQ